MLPGRGLIRSRRVMTLRPRNPSVPCSACPSGRPPTGLPPGQAKRYVIETDGKLQKTCCITPDSACRKANAFCSSVNRFVFIPNLLGHANQILSTSHSPWTIKQRKSVSSSRILSVGRSTGFQPDRDHFTGKGIIAPLRPWNQLAILSRFL